MGDPGGAARIRAIEPKVDLRKINAGLVKLDLHY
jgi:hypothetical protein